MGLKRKQSKGYAICRKRDWKAIVVFWDKAQAQKAIEGREREFEVREVIEL